MTPQRAGAELRSLLKQAPDFLDEASTVVRNPEGVWLRVMEEPSRAARLCSKEIRQLLRKVPKHDDDEPLAQGHAEGMESIPGPAKQRPLARPARLRWARQPCQRRLRA